MTLNFATFLMAYSCLLIAFGLSFSVLFSNYPAFHLPAGLVKTVMMMSGELEYEDIFYNNCTNSQIQYPFTAHGMFLVFVLLVTVILTNLLVGLAVSDIQVRSYVFEICPVKAQYFFSSRNDHLIFGKVQNRLEIIC